MLMTLGASGAVRRWDGFCRYAISLQYHGASFLGFSYQSNQEDCILVNGTDLRGYRSVEGRLRHALKDLFGEEHENWENIQVSSRTDRGVHAWKNTLHLDIRQSQSNIEADNDIVKKLRRGLNFHISRQQSSWERDSAVQSRLNRSLRRRRNAQQPIFTYLGQDTWTRNSTCNELRILSAARAPEYMANDYATSQDPTQPPFIDWNARFSATERTYVYRIIFYPKDLPCDKEDYAIPFEWDRSWRMRGTSSASDGGLNLTAMQMAASHLEGTHDFSSFRGARCQRESPVVTIRSIQVQNNPYIPFGIQFGGCGFEKNDKDVPRMVTIAITGNSFLYRQVRNIVGCLVEVGRGRLLPHGIPELLKARNRSLAPKMAPAHGLFLVDVQHGNFRF